MDVTARTQSPFGNRSIGKVHGSLRIVRVAVTGVLAAVLAAGCSSVREDAARVDGDRLSNESFQDLLEGYTEATLSGILPTGNVDANTARIILLDWIASSALERTLEEYGVELSQDDLDEAETSLDSQVGFAQAPQTVRDFYIRATAIRTVSGATFSPDAEELADIYANGPEQSGVACLRLILTDTREEIEAAIARIEAGESFADVAEEVSTDTSGASGGALTNSETGDECFPYDEVIERIVEQIGEAIPETRPGVVTGPIEIPDLGWVAITARPFTEVADDVETIIGPVTAQRLTDSALDNVSVWVNTEYGRWDPESRQVVAE